jgi:hypothetical protein
MTDIIEAVASMIDPEQLYLTGESDRIKMAKAAIEAARPYIIAEYNERLLSEGALDRAGIAFLSECNPMKPIDRFKGAEAAIKAAIEKANQ